MTNKTLYGALLAVQQAAPAIDKSANNPFFKSKYADLPTIWSAVRDLMGSNGLVVSHTMKANDNEDSIVTRIIHAETGEFIESESRILLGKATAQDYGSYITYMRRYALSAMLGLVTDEDDDGNKASNSPAVKPVKAKVVAKPAAAKVDFRGLIDALTTDQEFLDFRAEYKDAIQESADKEKIVTYFNKKKAEVTNV